MDLLVTCRMGNQAKEPQRALPRVAELMDFVGGDKDDIAAGDRMLLVAFAHHTVSFEHKHFMFVIVLVAWGVAASFDFEMAHGEVRRTLRFAHQLPDAAADRTFHLNGLLRDLGCLLDDQCVSPESSP